MRLQGARLTKKQGMRAPLEAKASEAPLIDLTAYKLTFDDEFNARSISQTGAGTTWADIRSEWRFDANSDIGFGHSSFVDPASGYDPFKVAGGALAITAVPDKTPSGYPGSWESGLITTQGGFSQTYGYFEMRADLSDAKGGWDAFWLLPDTPAANPNHLPGWQELDVVEHYGNYNQGTYRWIHTTDPGPNRNPNADLQVFSNNPAQLSGYHTYGMDWQADRISFYFDGQYMGSQPTPTDMHGPMYLLANLATQGAGDNDADAAGVPIAMKIDYIRAYSRDPNATAVTLDTVSAPDGHDPGVYGATVATLNSNVASIARLYYAVLDRAPDADGLRAYTNNLANGTSLHDVAQAFLISGEYKQASTGLTDAQFVDVLYGQILGRTGDGGGRQFWNSYLDQGGTRDSTVTGFTDSSEFQSKYAAQSSAAYVEALYEHVLGRSGDGGGLVAWAGLLDSHAMTRTGMARAFTGSAEFQAKYVAPSDASFVDGLYENALGRRADAGSLQAWMNTLVHGTSRADVAVSIVESVEAQRHLTSAIESAWHLI